MAANKPDFSLGRIDTPDVGGGLLDFADRQQKQYQIGLSNAVEADKLLRDRQRFAREQELNKRADTEYNREIGIREGTKKIATDFITNPETYGAQAELEPLWKAAEKESQRRLSAGEAPFSPEESSKLQMLAESRKPFREDAQGKVAAKLAEIGVANPHALAGEITAGLPSRAYMQEQADKNREVQQNYYNELTKNRIAYGKDIMDVSKTNAEAENKKAADVFEALQKMYGGGGSGSGGTVGGRTLADAQLAVQALDIGPMDTNDAYKLLNKGILEGLTPSQALYAIKNSRAVSSTAGLTTSNINEDLFDANIKDIKEKGIPGSGSGYKIERVGSVLSPEDYAPTMIQRQIVDYNPKGFEERLAKEAPFLRIQNGEPVQAPVSSTGGSIKTEMPESLQKAEGTRLEPYKDTKNNVTVSTGYNMSGKSRSELMQDFKEAGIDSNKIDGLLKMDGTRLTPVESKALDSVSYAKNGIGKLQKIGIDVDKLHPKLAEIAVSQAYRGDIVKDGSGYRGRLYDYLKNDDLSGMVKDITTSKDIPNEVKTRLKLVTGIGAAGAEGPRTRLEAEHIGPNDKGMVDPIIQKARDEATAFYKENGGGLLDYATAVRNIMQKTGLSRSDAMDMYNGVANSSSDVNSTPKLQFNRNTPEVTKNPNLEKAYEEAWRAEARRKGMVGTSSRPYDFEEWVKTLDPEDRIQLLMK